MPNIVYLNEIFTSNQLLKRTCDTNIDWFVLERIDRSRCMDISSLERQVEVGRMTQLEFDKALAELDRDMKQINLLHEMGFDTRDFPAGIEEVNPYLLSYQEADRLHLWLASK